VCGNLVLTETLFLLVLLPIPVDRRIEKDNAFRDSLSDWIPQAVGEAVAIGEATNRGTRPLPRYVVLTCGHLFVVVKYEDRRASVSAEMKIPKDTHAVSVWLEVLLSECDSRIGQKGSLLNHFNNRPTKRPGSGSGGASGSGASGGGSGRGGGGNPSKQRKVHPETTVKAPSQGKGKGKGKRKASTACRDTSGEDSPGEKSKTLTSATLNVYALRPLTLYENVHRLIGGTSKSGTPST